jgi:endonuclease-3
MRPVDTLKTQAVAARLSEIYGPRRFGGRRDPLGELVGTILSQSTSDINSGRAYRALRTALPTWPEVLAAPVEQVYELIKPAGLGRIKAPRIQQALADILQRTGALSLDFLEAMPLDEARAWLVSLAGVGPKTAACVLMFALGMPALPVDTHVHRVSQRLGLIGPQASAERAHALLEADLAPEQVYPFHVHLIQHGKQICHAQHPECGRCALADLCDYPFKA